MINLSILLADFLEVFRIKSINDFTPEMMVEQLRNEGAEIVEKWLYKYPDCTEDLMQPIYQYYLADRKVKKQDYTPQSLAMTAAVLAGAENAEKICDLCAGSGAMSIQAWRRNSQAEFIAIELDKTVIPFLIFNMLCRHMKGTVICADILTQEVFQVWRISNNGFDELQERPVLAHLKADICISNPPFNMKWDAPMTLSGDVRFDKHGTPSPANANYAFVLTALLYAERSALILPNSALTSDDEIRQSLIMDNLIDAVVTCPDSMFESTDIGTCIISLNRCKMTGVVSFVDARQKYMISRREQNGQFGGTSHTNRTYSKEIKVFTSDIISEISHAVKCRAKSDLFAKSVNGAVIAENNYSLIPSKYIELLEEPMKHRPYAEIVNDLNRVIERRNSCKLIINGTMARGMGIDVDLLSKSSNDFGNEFSDEFIKRIAGVEIIKTDYISFTKNKGEICFKNNSKESVPELLLVVLMSWRMLVMECNNEENKYLAELRDALIPDLMSGKITI